MEGAATLTIVPSMRSITSATRTTASTRQRRGSRVRGWSGEAVERGAAVIGVRGGGSDERCSRTPYVTNTVRVNWDSAYTRDVTASARERPARRPLSREAVLEAGLRVLRAQGVDGVTMRAVAAELDTGAASLYVYVANRKDLLDQMFDLVAGSVDPGPPPHPQHWQGQPLPPPAPP